MTSKPKPHALHHKYLYRKCEAIANPELYQSDTLYRIDTVYQPTDTRQRRLLLVIIRVVPETFGLYHLGVSDTFSYLIQSIKLIQYHPTLSQSYFIIPLLENDAPLRD
ncbi:hypothetical protein AVEN_81925-1 [Araneus ventricosus]|uniref:Uncharacterized protein n=1 Tax=Araneus ventricosus TaxID=182803 RepID=A0A4Y2GJ36_ARAVE|nr:hypothetical protein AVEN_81925-1 [Araneus ventricosus]